MDERVGIKDAMDNPDYVDRIRWREQASLAFWLVMGPWIVTGVILALGRTSTGPLKASKTDVAILGVIVGIGTLLCLRGIDLALKLFIRNWRRIKVLEYRRAAEAVVAGVAYIIGIT